MQNKTHGTGRRIIHFLLAAALVFSLLPPLPAQAATRKELALKAYKKILTQSTIDVLPKGTQVPYLDDTREYKGTRASRVSFDIALINNDTIPELILWDKRSHYFGVWTYRFGKVVCSYYNVYGTPVGYFKKKAVFRDRGLTGGSVVYAYWNKLVSGKASRILTMMAYDGYDAVELTYMVGKKDVSYATFTRRLKSYVGTEPMTKFTMRNNTKANRNKYLK